MLFVFLFFISINEFYYKKILIILFFFISLSIWLLIFFINPENFFSHPFHLFKKFLTFFMSDQSSTNLWFKLIQSDYFNLIVVCKETFSSIIRFTK